MTGVGTVVRSNQAVATSTISFADDLNEVIEQLDLRGVTLVGHSMGCMELVRYLSRHGAGRIARIAMVAPIRLWS